MNSDQPIDADSLQPAGSAPPLTPAVTALLEAAGRLAAGVHDNHTRLEHVEAALKGLTSMPPPLVSPMKPRHRKQRSKRGKTCACGRWFGWSKTHAAHVQTCKKAQNDGFSDAREKDL